jgi:aspartyl protease family protein
VVDAYQITLKSVDVGGIRVEHITGSVLEGAFPEIVLLGTTYLQHVEMSEKDGILLLMGKF